MFQKNEGNIAKEMYLILPVIVDISANRYFNDIRPINVSFYFNCHDRLSNER